ncbi:MAG: asparaginase [Nanoarchaeota archaeon]|nr:asparaginase [Nanoarchaeota archaeon]
MTAKKKISIIATGGTIASSIGEKGLTPTYKLVKLLEQIPDIFEFVEIHPVQLMNKDSSDMQPEDWVTIAKQVWEELEKCDGVVIVHGTDTMAYSSSILSFMLGNIKKPVILTGSQRPWTEPNSDARQNLIDAVRTASYGTEHSLKGVYVVFHGKIIKGCRTRKSKYLERSELDAFETVNYPLVGMVSKERIMINPILLQTMQPHETNEAAMLDTKIGRNVLMVTLTPGLNPLIFDSIRNKCDAIIIQAYGLGGMPIHGKETLLPMVKQWIDSGKIVAITSQACYETDLSQYEVGRRFLELGVIPTLDMTLESAYTKLMWVLGHTKDQEEVKKMLWKNYVGEIWPLNGEKGRRQVDVMSEMARSHELTRILYESNNQLMNVMADIYTKTQHQI